MSSSVTDGPKNSGLRSLAALVFLSLLAYWFVFASLIRQWISDPNYGHGLFIIPMAIVLAWRRRGQLRGIPARPSATGLLVIAAGGALYLVGILSAELFTSRLSFVVTLIGIVLVTQGTGRTRALLFPLLFLLFMIPVPYILYYKLTFPLQLKSSEFTEVILSIIGLPAVRSGNIIDLEGYTLEVVTACSGLRSIMTLGALAVFTADFLDMRAAAKVLFALLAVPVALVSNTFRLVSTAVISAFSDEKAADHFLHEFSGVVVFISGAVLLFITGYFVQWVDRRIKRS